MVFFTRAWHRLRMQLFAVGAAHGEFTALDHHHAEGDAGLGNLGVIGLHLRLFLLLGGLHDEGVNFLHQFQVVRVGRSRALLFLRGQLEVFRPWRALQDPEAEEIDVFLAQRTTALRRHQIVVISGQRGHMIDRA
ncbi:hypothetical protein [Prosthecobacter sp.]|uniref:hypothetical protein n=1 Tax=Prosthecobacter sp. TaxID=1965333 RepID=UPI003782DD86